MIRQAIAEMEGPEVPEDTNDGATNRSAEATASDEPMLYNPPQGATTPAESSSAAGPSHVTQPSPRPVATSQSPSLELHQSPDQDMKQEQPQDQGFKLDEPDISGLGQSSLPATSEHDAQTTLSSELSDLDSEV
jgi:hypothetical protein